ncbi:Ycf51 family protein [Lusitaniella coriacea]|uniref:Ycf51 family protein n=1 Tax=Lusitaniella coriacea TaxID=1983105 RepID=UPI003CE89B37
MQIPTDLATYTQWSGILTLVFLGLTLLSFVFKWGIRFRLVGATSFMGVITASIFALSLGLFTHTEIPGSVRYTLVYDNAGDKVVIVVPPTITESETAATLRQAAADIIPFGRAGTFGTQLTIRARTMLHPKLGVSQPLYLGQATKLMSDSNAELDVRVFSDRFAQLPKSLPESNS